MVVGVGHRKYKVTSIVKYEACERKERVGLFVFGFVYFCENSSSWMSIYVLADFSPPFACIDPESSIPISGMIRSFSPVVFKKGSNPSYSPPPTTTTALASAAAGPCAPPGDTAAASLTLQPHHTHTAAAAAAGVVSPGWRGTAPCSTRCLHVCMYKFHVIERTGYPFEWRCACICIMHPCGCV